ncbi:LD-carboxypeptidase [Psychrobacillus sp. OK032]|uniref:S66 peptidase family protein n=1 Tax=Psychrobacillus sp. OK032 TaxID=1884358 RepID=UPI0008AFC57D|nr:LD-carboxypeptidase [Psychrobacillus sp. OK032]SES40200.1 muramoyltetrapeptide carboxypeptidase [Psychrobacillus sp. OK032]
MKIRPKRLRQGDTIGIIAPSSPPNLEQLKHSLTFLEELGLSYKMGKSVGNVYGYLAGTDEERLVDLHEMFADSDIAGIICAGGGYGSARYTDKIDFQLMNECPKIFWGYSDITFLHTSMNIYSDIVTFHGPMLASDVGKDTFSDFSKKMFQQLFEPMELHYTAAISPLESLSAGVARGELTGGNLSLLASGIGTKYEVDTKGKLLLIEDIGEEPYRVDGMLNQLRQAGKLEEAAGFVIGDFKDAEPKKRPISLSLDEVLDHYIGQLGKPAVKGFKIGHCEPHFAVPLGAEAVLDADSLTLTILPGVE